MQTLEQIVRTFIAEAMSSDMDLCLTIEGKENPTAWVQITWDSLNVSFPVSAHPLNYIKSLGIALPKGSELLNFETESFATFSHDGGDIPGVTRFVQQYFHRAFQILPTLETVVLRREQLGKKRNSFSPSSAHGASTKPVDDWLGRLKKKLLPFKRNS
jgi:hypothetical protein